MKKIFILALVLLAQNRSLAEDKPNWTLVKESCLGIETEILPAKDKFPQICVVHNECFYYDPEKVSSMKRIGKTNQYDLDVKVGGEGSVFFAGAVSHCKTDICRDKSTTLDEKALLCIDDETLPGDLLEKYFGGADKIPRLKLQNEPIIDVLAPDETKGKVK